MEEIMSSKWFCTENYIRLEIVGRSPELPVSKGIAAGIRKALGVGEATPESAEKHLVITDANCISRLKELIEKVDPDGDEMRKPGPDTRRVELTFFTTSEAAEHIYIYDNMLKTPSTGFHSQQSSEEKAAVDAVDQILSQNFTQPWSGLSGRL